MPERTYSLSRCSVVPDLSDEVASEIKTRYGYDPAGRVGDDDDDDFKDFEKDDIARFQNQMIPCPTWFQECKNIQSSSQESLICRSGDRSGPIFFVTEANRLALVAAIQEESMFRWPKPEIIGRNDLYYPVLFGVQLWKLNKGEEFLSDDQLRLVFLEYIDKERRRFERLKAIHDGVGGSPIRHQREVIPEQVRMYVWRRDEGRCVECGSRERLEYDHLIPLSKGGSNTERNIQLLCEICNRRKGDSI